MKRLILAWLLIAGLAVAALYGKPRWSTRHPNCDCGAICAKSLQTERCNISGCNGMI